MLHLVDLLRKQIHIKVLDRKGSWFETLVVFAAIFGPFATLPQAIAVYTTKSAGNLSIITWVLYIIIGVIWIAYGIKHKEKPVIVSQTIHIIIDAFVVAGILIYS